MFCLSFLLAGFVNKTRLRAKGCIDFQGIRPRAVNARRTAIFLRRTGKKNSTPLQRSIYPPQQILRKSISDCSEKNKS
jgi:hypothetical protein